MEKTSFSPCKCTEHVSREEFCNLEKKVNTMESEVSQTVELLEEINNKLDKLYKLDKLDKLDVLPLMKTQLIKSNHNIELVQDQQCSLMEEMNHVSGQIQNQSTLTNRISSQLKNTQKMTHQVMTIQSSYNPSSNNSEGRKKRNLRGDNERMLDDIGSPFVDSSDGGDLSHLTDLAHKINKSVNKSTESVDQIKAITQTGFKTVTEAIEDQRKTLVAEIQHIKSVVAISNGGETFNLHNEIEQSTYSSQTAGTSSDNRNNTHVLDTMTLTKVSDEDGLQCLRSSSSITVETTQTVGYPDYDWNVSIYYCTEVIVRLQNEPNYVPISTPLIPSEEQAAIKDKKRENN